MDVDPTKGQSKRRIKNTPGQTGRAVLGGNDLTLSYTDEEREFIVAMDRYMTDNNRKFPAFHEVLAVLKSLGYRKVTTMEKDDAENVLLRKYQEAVFLIAKILTKEGWSDEKRVVMSMAVVSSLHMFLYVPDKPWVGWPKGIE